MARVPALDHSALCGKMRSALPAPNPAERLGIAFGHPEAQLAMSTTIRPLPR